MILGRFLRSDGRIRVFEGFDGDEVHCVGTRCRHGDIGPQKVDKWPLLRIDNVELFNEISRSIGSTEQRLSVSDDDFLTIEDAMVSQIMTVWNSKVDSGLKSFVAMMDSVNSEVTEEMIAQLIIPHLDEEIGEAFYSSAKAKTAIKTGVSRSWTAGKSYISNQLEIPVPRSAFIDTRAQNWMRTDTRFWLRHRWETHTREKIKETARKVGIEQGLGRREVGRALASAFKGVCGESPYYWEVVGSSAITRARSWSSIVTLKEANIKTGTIQTAGDERVCPVCGPMHGLEIPVDDHFDQVLETLDVDDPLKVRNVSPWINYSPAREKEGKPPYYISKHDEKGKIVSKKYFKKEKLNDNKFLLANGLGLPAYHGSCRCRMTA